jgi:hypothetical protein
MEGQFLINNNTISYLIHGQPLCLQYQIQGCWFVVISYNNGDSFFRKFYFRKPIGKFESVTNVYSPEISLWGIGWGIKKLFYKKLRINFFNTVTQIMYPKTSGLPAMPDFDVIRQNIVVKTPPVAVRLTTSPRFIANAMSVNAYDDYSTFKENKPSTNSNN